MAPEAHDLDANYNLLRLNIISSSAISNRTSALTKHLKTEQVEAKTAIVSLHAKATVANKLVSVVEIAKRDLKQSGIKVYQYNALGSETVEVKPLESRESKSNRGTDEVDGVSEEEEAFEVVGQRSTVRNVPNMTVYLSSVSIKELKESYGEQTG